MMSCQGYYAIQYANKNKEVKIRLTEKTVDLFDHIDKSPSYKKEGYSLGSAFRAAIVHNLKGHHNGFFLFCPLLYKIFFFPQIAIHF